MESWIVKGCGLRRIHQHEFGIFERGDLHRRFFWTATPSRVLARTPFTSTLPLAGTR